MSATKKRNETVVVDREMLLELLARVDGLAHYEALRNGGCHTPYQECVYEIIDPLERAVFGPRSDEWADAMRERGIEYGREMFRGLASQVDDFEAVAS